MASDKVDFIKQYLKKEFASLKEEETEDPEEQSPEVPEEEPTEVPTEEPAAPAPVTFETNPMEFILNKYPSLRDNLVTLLSNDFADYVTGIYIIAPRPTKFKIVLHNNRAIYLTYLGKAYEATVSGKRYYLSNLGDIQRATTALSELLTLGQPKEDLTGPETESGPAPTEGGKEEKPAKAEEPKVPEEGEEIELKESNMNTNEAKSASQISTGDNFTVTSDMGKFSAGDKVTVTDVIPYGNDIRIYMTSDSGIRDFIIVDKSDTEIDLDESDIYNIAGDEEAEKSAKLAKVTKVDDRLKDAITRYKELYAQYKKLPRGDDAKALASKRMVDLNLAIKKNYGFDLEKVIKEIAKRKM